MSMLLPAAMKRIRINTAAWFAVGNTVLLGAAVLWLYLTESSILQLLLTVLLGAGVVVGFAWLQSRTMRLLRAPNDPASSVIASLVLLGWAILLWLLRLPLEKWTADGKIFERASYINSQLGPHLRAIFTYGCLADWQVSGLHLLLAVVLPAVLLPLTVETVSRHMSSDAWRNAVRCWLRWQYWLSVGVIGGLWFWAQDKILDWTPGKSVHGEIISVVLRLAFVYAMDVALALAMLAITSELLARSDVRRQPTA